MSSSSLFRCELSVCMCLYGVPGCSLEFVLALTKLGRRRPERGTSRRRRKQQGDGVGSFRSSGC
uniref:Uncharacterized protein n=1 Tax=Oryza rufipogon TaxID=4529 RepID=A0A0E0Q6R0_ORYRU